MSGHPPYASRASLSTLDITVSVVLHLLILAAILAFGLWHRQTQVFHPAMMKVHLISAHRLEQLQHRENRATRFKKRRHKSKKKSKPVLKLRHKPVTKLKPKPALRHKTKSKPRTEDHFNPFKPLESTTDIKSSPVIRPKAAQVFQGQLSSQEINHYIALIQEAVQKHWRVPNTNMGTRNPLVKMVLNPDGSVRNVQILESSGNMALDASLVRAIEAASPFLLPSEHFGLFRNNKIRFHPLR